LPISDHLSTNTDQINQVDLQLVLFGAKTGDQIGACLNGIDLKLPSPATVSKT
jgi:hypothetical protein